MEKEKIFEAWQMQGVSVEMAREYISWVQNDHNAAVGRFYHRESQSKTKVIPTPLSVVYLATEGDDLQTFQFLDMSKAERILGIEMNGRYWARETFTWKGWDLPHCTSLCLTKDLSPAVSTVACNRGYRLLRKKYVEVTSLPIKKSQSVNLYVPAVDDLRITEQDIKTFNQTVKILRDNGVWAEYWEKRPHIATAKKEWEEVELIGHDFAADSPYFRLNETELYTVRPLILVDYND